MEILSSSDPHLIISTEKVPVSAYQAIYHKLTSKVESLREVFIDLYEIDMSHISHLHFLLKQTVVQFPVQESRCEITVSLHKAESYNFTDFIKFQSFNFVTNKPTARLAYNLDFFTVLPVEIPDAQDIVQRFKVTILVDQDFVDDNEFPGIYFESFLTGSNISLIIEYSDYSVARNIQGAVRDWVAGLPTKKKSQFIEFMTIRSDLFISIVPALFASALLAGISSVPLSTGLTETRSIANIVLKALSLSMIAYIVGQILVKKFLNALHASRPLSYLMFTAGDKTRKTDIQRARARSAKISNLLGIAIVLAIIVNLFSSYLWERI